MKFSILVQSAYKKIKFYFDQNKHALILQSDVNNLMITANSLPY